MKSLKALLYTRTNEWVDIMDNFYAYLGMSDYGISILNGCKYVSLPEVGQEFKAGESLANIESSTSEGDVYAPFDCKIIEINQNLIENPYYISDKPYETWLVKIKSTGSFDRLISYEEYQEEIRE